jgi:hypothetical protein
MAVFMTVVPASAQSNLDAGKTPAQIFANTCNACHRSPREIRRTTAAFMREHYTTGMQEAATMAAYLATVGTDPKAVEQRRKPVLGAGKESPSGEPKASGEAQAALNGAKSAPNGRSRRPSESFEAAKTLTASFMADQPAAPLPASPVLPATSAFEE